MSDCFMYDVEKPLRTQNEYMLISQLKKALSQGCQSDVIDSVPVEQRCVGAIPNEM